MSKSVEEFEDPQLKAAIQRAIPLESAPPALRNRVASVLMGARRANPWLTRSRRVYALAAVLVVGLGIGVTALVLANREPAVPDWFADAMITTHDTCRTLADHQLIRDLPQNDLNALRARMQETLGHPALIAMLGDGWVFKGAGLCEVNRVLAGHLMFAKGDDTISIFSISSRLLYTTGSSEGLNYSETRNGHEVAGFVSGGAIHCLVGLSPKQTLTLRQVRALRDQLRSSPSLLPAGRQGLRIDR